MWIRITVAPWIGRALPKCFRQCLRNEPEASEVNSAAAMQASATDVN